MAVTITVCDETTAGERSEGFDLEFLTERVTVRELIRARVYQEVQDFNVAQRSGGEHWFRGLVEPTDAEKTLNGSRLRTKREIDWEKQFKTACEAFERNGFLILVGEKQVSLLDDEVVLQADVAVSFLKLVPLIGG